MNIQTIQNKIYVFRSCKAMLDYDLAELYQTDTRTLKQAVRRNLDRFPNDFMFQLTNKETDQLVSQNVIPSKSHLGGALPFAFTEQGVAMLSSVLKSKKAVQVNIAIMRAFVLLRQHLSDYRDLKEHIEILETEMNRKFKDVYEALNYLIKNDTGEKDWNSRKQIGYKNKPL